MYVYLLNFYYSYNLLRNIYISIKIVVNHRRLDMKISKNSIVKAALIFSIALAMVMPASAVNAKTKTTYSGDLTIVPQTIGARDIIFQDSFESYEDFAIEFSPWTNIDVDGGTTYGMQDSSGNPITWPNNNTAQAYIIFNQAHTNPPVTDLPGHSGDKLAACVSDVPSTAPDGNNDWLISPQMHGAPFDQVSFWARAYTNQYGPESFYVCVSTTDTDPSSFATISPLVQPPETYTQYTYDLSGYSGNDIYIAINCISYDCFILMIDDFQVTGTGYVIDTAAPVTTCALEGTQQGGVYTSDVTVTLTATDGGSGVNYTKYKLDDGEWTTYSAPFIVTDDGAHTVLFYSVDIAGNQETEKSSAFTIQHAAPITITIKGGFGVSATIKNTGTTDLTNIDWTITLDGKLIFVGKTKTNTIAALAAGEEVVVKDFVIGFGKTGIAVEAGSVTASASGTVLLFLVIGVA
jgi:hypothetical protein